MKNALLALAVIASFAPVRTLLAADAYALLFNATGRQYASGAPIIWTADVLFFNANQAPAEVRLLSVSNGTMPSSPLPLTLAPGVVTTLSSTAAVAASWVPLPTPAMWTAHLDVPSGVTVESRDELYVSTGVPEIGPTARGKVSMPVLRALVPPNTPQIHIGTDLGGNASRANAVIYNAGNDTATATITVRRTCDNAVVDERSAAIPPNTVVQVTGLSTTLSGDCPSASDKAWQRYTMISVNQPSLSIVSNVNESIQPTRSDIGVLPIVGLGVAANQQF